MSSASIADRRARALRDRRAMTPLLRGVAALVLLSLAMVTVARVTGMEPAAAPPPDATVVQSRLIRISGELGGGARVADADGVIFADLDPTQAGFVNGVARALERVRMLNKVAGEPPVELVRFDDGRLSLRDPSTGWGVELIGFGDTNRDAFAALLGE